MAFLVSAAIFISMLVPGTLFVSAADSSSSEAISLDETQLAVVVDAAVDDEIVLSAGNTVVSAVSTNPATVTVGIGCGACTGGCGSECPDEWGYCQCNGHELVTPTLSVVTGSDSAIATATLNNGQLTVEGVSNGTTSIVIQASFQSKNYDGSLQGVPRVSQKTISIVVSDTGAKTKLDAPDNLVLTDSTLTWDAADNAASYLVRAIDERDATNYYTVVADTNSLDLLSFSPTLAGGTYDFTVKAIPAADSTLYGSSDYSAGSVTYVLPKLQLDTPTGVTYNSSVRSLSWAAVSHASRYTVFLTAADGTVTTLATTTTTTLYTYIYTIAPGIYQLSVQAIAAADYLDWYFDENWNYFETQVITPYADSAVSAYAGETLASGLTASVSGTSIDGTTVYLKANDSFDLTDFNLNDSGISLTVNGEDDPLVSVSYDSDDHYTIALKFQNAIQMTDEYTFILNGGTLKSSGGYTYDNYSVSGISGAQPEGYVALYSGKGSDTAAVTYSSITDSVYDSKGNLYVADSGANVIRKIDTATGTVTTVAGTGSAPSVLPSITNGVTLATAVDMAPNYLAIDSQDNLYITTNAWSGTAKVSQIYKVDTASGAITVVAGTGENTLSDPGSAGVSATATSLYSPQSIAVDSQGNLYFAETTGYIRKIDTSGLLTAFAGIGGANGSYETLYGADGVTQTSAAINANYSVGLNVLTDSAQVSINDFMTIYDDVLYYSDGAQRTQQLRSIDLNPANDDYGIISVKAGAPRGATDGVTLADGVDASSVLWGGDVTDMTRDDEGNLYVAVANSAIYMISAQNNKVYTIGSGNGSYMSPNFNDAKKAYFSKVKGLNYYDGALYFGQTNGFTGIAKLILGNPVDAEVLNTPTGLSIAGDVLTWSSVDNAYTYTITMTASDGTVTTDTVQRTSSYDFASRTYKLQQDTYSVTVTANPVSPSYTSSAASAALSYDSTSYAADHVVIAEVYGGGGMDGATYANDYVVLYNPTSEAVDLSGWSAQVYNGTTNASIGAFALDGVIMPHGYYLLKGASSGDAGTALPGADAVNTAVDIQPLNFRVALVNDVWGITGLSDENLVDLVADTGNLYEGTAVAKKPSSVTQSVVRIGNSGDSDVLNTNGNGWDTDNNQKDFVVSDTNNPRNSYYTAPGLISAVSGSLTVAGSSIIGGSLTATPSLAFTSGTYGDSAIESTNYYWYVNGKLAQSSADSTFSTAGLSGGDKVVAAVQLFFTDGQASGLIYSDSTVLSVANAITGYSVYTNHSGEADSSGLDDQQVHLTVQFADEITLLDAEAAVDELQIQINAGTSSELTYTSTPNTELGTETYPGYATVAVGADGKSLEFTIHIGFAVYAGHLTVTAANGITQILDTESGYAVGWTDVDLYIPNGVELETVSVTAGDTAAGVSASTTKQVVTDADCTRAMVHMLFLKDGEIVGTVNSYGANLVTHYHNYLTMDSSEEGSATFAGLVVSFFNSTFGASGYTATADGDTVTITDANSSDGEVLDLLIYAYPRDEAAVTEKDTTALTATIVEAGGITDAAQYNADSYANFTAALSKAQAVAANDSTYYLQSEIDAAATALSNAILALGTVPGDVDGDGQVTVSDVVELRGLILTGAYTGDQLLAGDVDGSGTLTVSDVVELRALILKGA